MDLLAFDIETGPQSEEKLQEMFREPTLDDFVASCPANWKRETCEGKYPEAKAKAWEKFVADAALSAITGRVVAVGIYICGDGVDEQDSQAIIDCDGDRESEGLEEFWVEVSDALYAGVSIAGWNIYGFDLPFLVRRSWMLDVAVPEGLRKGRYWSEQLIDLMQVWGFHGREYTKLDVAAKALGLKGKVTEAAGTEVCGADFHRLWRENRKAAEEYLNQDVRLCVQIANCMGII